MPMLHSKDAEIHWKQTGSGPPVVLVHGFGESAERMWEQSGWVESLEGAGRRVVRFDLRGHGLSEKVYDPVACHIDRLTDDLANVVREAGATGAHFVGFSLGSEILFRYLLKGGARDAVGAVFIGMGRAVLRPRRRATALSVEAMSAEDPAQLHPALRKLRRIHEGRGNDLRSLIALLRAEIERVALEPDEMRALDLPVLFVAGENEQVVGDVEPVADLVKGSRIVRIPGTDHDATPLAAEARAAVLDFLS